LLNFCKLMRIRLLVFGLLIKLLAKKWSRKSVENYSKK
jgi:hypothetical protein